MPEQTAAVAATEEGGGGGQVCALFASIRMRLNRLILTLLAAVACVEVSNPGHHNVYGHAIRLK